MDTSTRNSRLVPLSAAMLPATGAARRGGDTVVGGPAVDDAPGRPLVLAHRGAPGPQRVENTVRAVESALRCGADGVEVDVRLAADGVLVCSHDPWVRSDSGHVLAVPTSSSTELRRAATRPGDRVATLEEVLAVVRDRPHSRLVVEVKPVAHPLEAARTVAALHEALQGTSQDVDLTVSSFDPALLGLVRRALRGRRVRTALLGHLATPVHEVLRATLDAGHEEVHLSLTGVRRAPHVVRLAHQLGIAVAAWTVNGRSDLRRLAEWGVDAVITDNVTVARTALAQASGVLVGVGATVC